MGVYAQTNYYIEVKNKKVAEQVAEKIKELQKKDKNGNTFFEGKLEIYKDQVCGFMSSGRIQNLEWRCEQIWDSIKDIDGVETLDCPFLSEADGCYFCKD